MNAPPIDVGRPEDNGRGSVSSSRSSVAGDARLGPSSLLGQGALLDTRTTLPMLGATMPLHPRCSEACREGRSCVKSGGVLDGPVWGAWHSLIRLLWWRRR